MKITTCAVVITILSLPPIASGQGIAVQSFTLMNSDTNRPIAGYDPIANGATLNLATLPTRNLNIRINTAPMTVGSVRVVYAGITRVENIAPYSMTGDTNGVYRAWTPVVGPFAVTATAFTGANASGTASAPVTLKLNVTNLQTATTYAATINSGSGSGRYAAGARVSITANAAPGGSEFDRWTGDTAILPNITAASVAFSMPARDVRLTATYRTSTTRRVAVPAGASLQAAIDTALPGDTLVLQAGATYTGLFTLPAKVGTAYVTITSSAVANLPEGRRVGPASSAYMPKIVSPTGAPPFITAPGAHHYKLVGLDITCAAGIYCHTLVQVGTGFENTDAELPYAFELDRVYVHGSTGGGKRGVQLNGKALALRNSHLSGFFSDWQETQAVSAWNTPGPLIIDNNYLEASAIGILIGGAEPALAGVTPSDISIVRNYVTRPLAWRSRNYVVKNLIELKTGRRVSITGNLLENSWTASQVGYAFNFKPGTENVRTPAITTNVVVADNIIRRTAGLAIVTGRNSVKGTCSGVTFRNNLLEDIGSAWGGAPLFTIIAAANVVIHNNTGGLRVTNTNLLIADGTTASPGFVFRANILPHGIWGVKGSGQAVGTATLNYYFPGSVFSNNVLYGEAVNPAMYPPGNYFPLTIAEIGWIDPAGGNYRLSSTSTYGGTGINGQDPGISSGPLFQ